MSMNTLQCCLQKNTEGGMQLNILAWIKKIGLVMSIVADIINNEK